MIIQQWTTWQKYIFVCWKLRVWLKSKTSIFLMLKVHFKSTFQYFAIFCRWINCVEFSSIEFVKGKVGRCVCNQKYFAVEFNLGIYWPPTRICVEGVGADIYETHLGLWAPRFWVEFATQKKRSHCKLKPTKEEFDDPAVLLHICQLRVANVWLENSSSKSRLKSSKKARWEEFGEQKCHRVLLQIIKVHVAA